MILFTSKPLERSIFEFFQFKQKYGNFIKMYMDDADPILKRFIKLK